MDHTGSTTDGTFDKGLVCILLAFHTDHRVDCNGAKPIVGIIITSGRLRMDFHSGNNTQQFFIQFLHVSMMRQMVIHDRHLTAADTSTDIGKPVVVADGLMLVVWIALARLRRQPHDLLPFFRIRTYQRTSAGGRDHLVAVE